MAERMTGEWQQRADSAARTGGDASRGEASFFGMIASEHREMFGKTAALVRAIPSFGDLPLTVLASGKPNPAFGPAAEAYQKSWGQQSRALTGKSTRSRFVLAEGSSHDLYLDVPDLVVENILSVVDAVRGGRR
jgi:hypothetical protein